MNQETIRLGIGFATGRKAFRKVMSAYIYSWNEFIKKEQPSAKIELFLFVAYDLSYSNAQSTDFTNLSQEIVDSFEDIIFIDEKRAKHTAMDIIHDDNLQEEDMKLIFSSGYAGKRNAIVYAALKNQMDYLLFLDDDEYPVAVTNSKESCLWSGQYVIPMHLKSIVHADITNGYHCGYISPIPQISFDNTLSQTDFRQFIEAISNDVITWESIRTIMKNGGVTYADTKILTDLKPQDVPQMHSCKFITGSNLCLNLTKPKRLFPFYNPPGARGEDTFLSTLLTDRSVVRVPCYTFHDGFSAYRHLLDGVLPIRLDSITAESSAIITRFYQACIGWVRYKPLLLYITDTCGYESKILEIQHILELVLPKICACFQDDNFYNLLPEFRKYSKNAAKHYQKFIETQQSWAKLMDHIESSRR